MKIFLVKQIFNNLIYIYIKKKKKKKKKNKKKIM